MSDRRRRGDVVSLSGSGLQVRGKDVQMMRRYWESMRRNGDVPRRSDIDPRGIEALLENAMIAEKIAPGLARLRIAGQHLSDLMGMEVRGMPVSAFIAPEHRDQLAQAMTELFERPAIMSLSLVAPPGAGQPELHGVMSLMPLRSDLGDISRALGCLITKGGIGRTPRRFEIAHVKVERIDPGAMVQPAPVTQDGFAETARPFEHDRAPLRSERPYLRLVDTKGE